MKQRVPRFHGPGSAASAALATAVAALCAVAPAASHACGACVEDKVAATYDHGAVQRAAARGDVVVFCELAGPFDPARLKAAARGALGVRSESVRVSVQPAALSFVIEPQLASPQTAVDVMQRAVAPGTRLTIVRLLAARSSQAR